MRSYGEFCTKSHLEFGKWSFNYANKATFLKNYYHLRYKLVFLMR